MDKRDLHLVFNDLDKVFDKVLRDVLWNALKTKEVRTSYI